jgi:hypothetical protein
VAFSIKDTDLVQRVYIIHCRSDVLDCSVAGIIPSVIEVLSIENLLISILRIALNPSILNTRTL